MARDDWNPETFRAETLRVGGPDAIIVLDDGLAWRGRWGGLYDFGHGPNAPMYFAVPGRAHEKVKALCINHAGDVGVMYRNLDTHAPFDQWRMRRELTDLLNEIDGIKIPVDPVPPRGFNVKLEVLRNPEKRAAFFAVFDDVAHFLRGPSAWGQGRARVGLSGG